MKTDIPRWEETSKQTPTWVDRNRVISSLVPKNTSVLDVGAGNMDLARMIPPSCTYQPLDCVQGREDTIVYDFNSNLPPPTLPTYDVVLCSGVLEYMIDIEKAASIIFGWGNTTIMSYAITDATPRISQREQSGWFNHLSANDVEQLIYKNNKTIEQTVRWMSQTIYVVS